MKLPTPATSAESAAPVLSAPPTFREALIVWIKIGLLSFGGPAGQIALMHRLVVDEKKWIDEQRFLHALNFCMLLPGPEAQQLATYVGWLLHGVRGGLAAGLLFIIPGAIVILALSGIYVAYSEVPLLAALFLGIKSAVLVIVVEALLRIGKRILKNATMKAIAVLAFLGIFVGNVPFPIIVLGAALIGLIGARIGAAHFTLAPASNAGGTGSPGFPQRRSILTTLSIACGGSILWFLPVGIAMVTLGSQHVMVAEGLFFSKLAVVTFGGAYAVLAYMAQQAVEVHAWLTAGEMMDGLGLAESTPGPLIMVTQFVGFLGAYRNPAPFDPVTAGILGSALTVWVTFVPCFLWIFMGAPYVERLRANPYLGAALSAITAAVVGVIANLAVWFGVQVLFREVGIYSEFGLHLVYPQLQTVHWTAIMLTAVAAVALLRFHANVIITLCGCAALAVLLVKLAL